MSARADRKQSVVIKNSHLYVHECVEEGLQTIAAGECACDDLPGNDVLGLKFLWAGGKLKVPIKLYLLDYCYVVLNNTSST